MIGIFDSGLGGLTVARAVRETFPSADILYFGDTKNAPYGGKSPEEISMLTVGGLRTLHAHGATTFVSACNSVSTSLALSILATSDFSLDRVVEMVGPTVVALRGFPGRILLVATEATIRSGIYQSAFRMTGKDIGVCPMPMLAGALENGSPDEVIRGIIAESLQHIDLDQYDMVLLGCTHYPLALSIFRELLPESIDIFDPAEAVASVVGERFWPQEVGDARLSFLVSRDSSPFRACVQKLFSNERHTVTVV